MWPKRRFTRTLGTTRRAGSARMQCRGWRYVRTSAWHVRMCLHPSPRHVFLRCQHVRMLTGLVRGVRSAPSHQASGAARSPTRTRLGRRAPPLPRLHDWLLAGCEACPLAAVGAGAGSSADAFYATYELLWDWMAYGCARHSACGHVCSELMAVVDGCAMEQC